MNKVSDPTGDEKPAPKNTSSDATALLIGLYLAFQIVVLSKMALTAWLTTDCSTWWPAVFGPLHLTCADKLSPHFATFQRLVISGSMAGLGGAVYMARAFFQKYGYGFKPPDKDGKEQDREYLTRQEIPRYVLLPFSSVVLGPVGIALAQGGAITLTGSMSGKELPLFTVVSLSFILGFTYHDTLNWMAGQSEKFFGKKDTKAKKPEGPTGPTGPEGEDPKKKQMGAGSAR